MHIHASRIVLTLGKSFANNNGRYSFSDMEDRAKILNYTVTVGFF